MGVCSTPEKLSTVALGVVAGVVVLRPWRRSLPITGRSVLMKMVVPAVVVSAALTTTACGGKSTPSRPATAATLQIVAPTPNEVTGPDLTIRFNVVGGTVHVSVDGVLVSMAFGTTQDLHGLKAGLHTMTAEWVAIDHLPFRNRVVAAVLFQVR